MKSNIKSNLVYLIGIALVCVPACWGQAYTITTVAGGANPYFLSGAGDGGQATSAALGVPDNDVAVDGSGNLYIAAGGLIRKVAASTHIISTIAGGGVSVGDFVPATQAALSPTAVTVDAAGSNLYIADTAFGISRIRQVVTATGIITTVAGGGPCCALGDGGPATNAYLAVPYGLALDSTGNLYIAQASTSNNLVRKVTNGTITTVAGAGPGPSLARPTGVSVDSAGNVYIADAGSNKVLKLSGSNLSTVAGSGAGTNSGDGGQATQAGIHAPWHVAVDSSNNIFITQYYDASIRWVAPSGTINTIASSGQVDIPAGITTDSHGVAYVADDNPEIPTVKSLATQAPGLTITKTHTGSFTQGQIGTYTVTVSNTASVASNGLVTVTDTLPAPWLLPTALAGTGWTCALPSVSCTRSDALAPGQSYPTITVTVAVADNAPASVINQASVSGGGSASANASDPTTIGAASSHPAFFSGEVSLGSGVYYLKFPNGNIFGYYNYQFYPVLYHYDLGFEAFIDGGNASAYMYDFASGHWWYTSPSLFPYLYDFTLNTFIYYFPDTKNPGHYTTNPRSFANLTTGKIITM